MVKDKPVERVVFNAITRQAVLEAMQHPRKIDPDLVDAYLARRALDYLVGFSLSPMLWRKLPGARSAGRVQSVALRLICDRELEIEAFKAQEYWTIEGDFATGRGDQFSARLCGDRRQEARQVRHSERDLGARDRERHLPARRFAVESVESKPVKRHPYAPFRTATLQQEASRKLGIVLGPHHADRPAPL